MQNSDVSSDLTAGAPAGSDERLEWERPALQRLGANDAEGVGAYITFDGSYYS